MVQWIICSVYANPRLKTTINENWKFAKREIPAAESLTFDDTDWETVNLPHTWNVEDTEDEPSGYYRGVGWYRKSVKIGRLAQGKKVFLCFEAANQVTEVWVNGRQAGEAHIGGYTPFAYDITSLITSGVDNTIAIKVDNSHHEDIAPLSADFTFFGGIYRDLYLVYTDEVHFPMSGADNGVFVRSYDVSHQSAQIEIKTDLKSVKGNKLRLLHTLKDREGKTVATSVKKVLHKEEVCVLEIKNPHLWDTENPYLYTVVSELTDESGTVLDRVKNPLGIRWFTD